MDETPNIDEALKGIFATSGSATGEEEILKVVAEYALQLPAAQIQCILKLKDYADRIEPISRKLAKRLRNIIDGWLLYKKYNNTGRYVLAALDSYGLGQYIKRGLIDINVQKK